MRIVISGVICLLIAGVGAAIVIFTLAGGDKTAGAASAPAELPTVPVRIEVLQPSVVEDTLYLTGRLFAWEEAVISAEMAGAVDWRGVERGARVQKGQELFHVDVRSIRALLNQAEARHTQAKQALERARNLHERGVGTQQSLDQAIIDESILASELENARIQHEKSVVRAPFDGLVDVLDREVGEFVDAGTALLRLIRTDPINAAIPVPEADIRYFEVGSNVVLSVEALPGEVFEGGIFRIATSADTLTRTFGVEVAIENPDMRLKPGMTVRARLVRREFHDAITAPLFSIISMENQRFAVVEEDGEAHIRHIEVGRIVGDRVHVTRGLSAGERLIVTGHRDLREGQRVTVDAETPGI